MKKGRQDRIAETLTVAFIKTKALII